MEFVLLKHAFEYIPSSYGTVQGGSECKIRENEIRNATTKHLHYTRECIDAEPVCEALLPFAFIHVSIRPYARSLPFAAVMFGYPFKSKVVKQQVGRRKSGHEACHCTPSQASTGKESCPLS